MINRLTPRRRIAVVAGVVLAGGLVAGGATAFADTSATASPSPSATAAHPKAGKHRRLRLRAPGVHGEATVKDGKIGQWVVREWQRGRITAVSGDTVTVRSADGTSWTWTVPGSAKITRDGGTIAESALKDGDPVLVVGRKDGSANDARRVFAPSPAQLAKLKAKAAQRAAQAAQQG